MGYCLVLEVQKDKKDILSKYNKYDLLNHIELFNINDENENYFSIGISLNIKQIQFIRKTELEDFMKELIKDEVAVFDLYEGRYTQFRDIEDLVRNILGT